METKEALLLLLTTLSVAPPYMRSSFVPLALLSHHVRKGFAAFGNIAKRARAAVATRLEENDKRAKQRVDLLGKLFEVMREKGERVDFGLRDIDKEMAGGFLAGSDTTAIAMTATL